MEVQRSSVSQCCGLGRVVVACLQVWGFLFRSFVIKLMGIVGLS